MAKQQPRAARAGTREAKLRLAKAKKFLEIAELQASDLRDPGSASVAAGNAILAGIAASDAICARRLGVVPRGQSHHEACQLLAGATPDGAALSRLLAKLLDLKDEAHYGAPDVSATRARDTVKWAAACMAVLPRRSSASSGRGAPTAAPPRHPSRAGPSAPGGPEPPRLGR